MAVTITQQQATVAIRAATAVDQIPAAVAATMDILWPAAVAIVDEFAPAAPDAVSSAAAVRLVGWLYEADPAEAQLGRALQVSGAAPLLAQWRVHRAGSIGGVDGQPSPAPEPAPTPGGGSFTPQSAFAFYTAPTLNQTTAGAGVAIPNSGNVPRFTLLPLTEIPGPIDADNPFFTFWEGTIRLDIANNRTIQIALVTEHAFGPAFAKKFSHRRVWTSSLRSADERTIAMAAFNSVSRVALGSYTPPGETPLEITADDLALPSKIGYSLEVTAFTTGTETRAASTLDEFESDALGSVSYQLRQAVSAGGGVAPAPSGGNVPTPPGGSGRFILVSDNGVLKWVSFPAPS